MGLELNCELTDGRVRTVEVSKEAVSLSLSHMAIESVDLSPLAEIRTLETLSLYSNFLKSLDLSPLSKCRHLRSLRMSINSLGAMDLSPLSECKNLQELDIGPNEISKIDFSPLTKLTSLKRLRIDGNKISRLDLSPLAGLSELQFLDLSMNQLGRIDLWPIASCINLDKLLLDGNDISSVDISPLVLVGSPVTLQKDMSVQVVIHPDLEVNSKGVSVPGTTALAYLEIDDEVWNKLRHSVLRFSHSFTEDQEMRFQRMFLKLLGIDELGVYDGPLSHILSAIPENADFVTIRDCLYDRMIELVGKQIASKGPTLFMNVDRLSVTRGRKLVPNILERREKEIQSLKIPVFNNRANLVPLWLTSYGHAVLKSLGIRDPEVSKSRIKKIRSALKEVGYKLSTTKVKDPVKDLKCNPKGSSQLRNYIIHSDHALMENHVEFKSPSRVLITPAVTYYTGS